MSSIRWRGPLSTSRTRRASGTCREKKYRKSQFYQRRGQPDPAPFSKTRRCQTPLAPSRNFRPIQIMLPHFGPGNPGAEHRPAAARSTGAFSKILSVPGPAIKSRRADEHMRKPWKSRNAISGPPGVTPAAPYGIPPLLTEVFREGEPGIRLKEQADPTLGRELRRCQSPLAPSPKSRRFRIRLSLRLKRAEQLHRPRLPRCFFSVFGRFCDQISRFS